MVISVSPSIRVAKMQRYELTTDDFLAHFDPANVREQATKDGPNYIAGRLLDYTKPRGKGNVIDRCAVVLDCDDADKEGVKALCEAVKSLGHLAVVHSTYSSTPDKPRVRVVIPLAGVVVPGDYRALSRALMNHLDMVTWDESCAQAERAMYMPAKPVGGDYWAVKTDGPLMDGAQWLKAHAPVDGRKKRASKGNVAKRDKRRKPKNDTGIRGAFNRVYTIADAIEEYDLPYEPCRDGRWAYYGSHTEGGLRLVEGREDLCISEHANTDPACFVDGNGSHRALSAFELCAVHLYGEDDDTTVSPRERASMQKMVKRAAEDERVREELGTVASSIDTDITWVREAGHRTRVVALHMAEDVRDHLAYVTGLGWMAYFPEEGIWKYVGVSGAANRVLAAAENWEQAALATGDESLVKRVKPLCGTASGRNILVHLEEMVTLSADDFDTNPDLLCVKNGVVDLRTSELMPHDAKYRMMRQTATRYVPGATHPAWIKALQCLDVPERTWFQVWLGCGITGHQPRDREASVPILRGGGANGKTVLTSGVMGTLDGYAKGNTKSLLMPENDSAFAHAAVSLKGARLVLVEEMREGVLDGNAVKKLASTPTLVAEAKYQMPFEFKTTHSLMITTNNLPRLNENTDGVNRRLAMLKFPYRYVDNPRSGTGERKIDASLDDAMKTPEVQEAILAWLVDGARYYYEAGRHVQAPTVSMATDKAEWLGNVDTLAGFFGEMLIADESGMIPMTHLYAAFNDYQHENGGKAWNKATFKNRLESHRLFSELNGGKLRTTGMSLYRDEYGNGPKAPTGGRVSGLRGLRFRTPADDVYEEPEVEVVAAPAPAVVEPEPEPEALIPAEDIPAPTPHVVPEREELERQGLIEELDGLACFVQQLPGGHEEVIRLAYEEGATSRQAPLGKLRAFKIRLEGALARLTVQHQGLSSAGESNERRQE